MSRKFNHGFNIGITHLIKWAFVALLPLSLVYWFVPRLFPITTVFDYNPQLIPSNEIEFEGSMYDPHTAKYVLVDRFFVEIAKYNISAFVLDGVLLGYMRYGSILPWDHDIEIRFVSESDASRYMLHRQQIRAALGSDPDDPEGALTLGSVVWPKIEYPGLGGDAVGEGARYCGDEINSCGFNEVGTDAWKGDCIKQRAQVSKVCQPLRPVTLRGKHENQVARVMMPHDVSGFGEKYKKELWKCVPNQQQCTIRGCASFSLLHFWYYMTKHSVPCSELEDAFKGLGTTPQIDEVP